MVTVEMQPDMWPNRLDQSVLDAMLSIRSELLTSVMKVITTVGNTFSMFGIALIATVWLLYRRRTSWGLACAGTWLVALGMMQGLKLLFGRERPPLPIRLVEIESHSFPSGHAMMSMTVLVMLALTVRTLTGRRWPVPLAIIGTLAIGFSRIYLAAHWTTDVLAGWALGAIVVAIGFWIRSRTVVSITPTRAERLDHPAAPRDAAQ